MRTDELIRAIREQALEFDHDPITDDGILRRVNFAYAYAYNHFAKSNDSLFAKWFYFDLKFGLSTYDIPRELWGKRIETLECPTPPQSGYEPFNYVSIDRVDPQSFPKYDSPRARTLLPLVWTQLRNKIMIAPPPLVKSRVRILATPAPAPLGLVEGLIQDIRGDELILDRAPTALLSQNLNALGQNLVSICDGMTGEVKAIYPYVEINGTTLKLGNVTNKTVLRSQPVRKLHVHDGYELSYDSVAKTITMVTQSPVVDVALGDYVEVNLQVGVGDKFNIVEGVTDDTDPYNPPEFTFPEASLTRGGRVVAFTSNSITWEDLTAVPALVDGYVNPPGSALSGTVTAKNADVYLGNPVVRVTCGAAHGLAVGALHKVTIAGTGTALDGVQKVVAKNATELYVLIAAAAGVLTPGTWALYQYPGALTGWPELKEVAIGTPSLPTIQVAIRSPYTYTLLPQKNNNDPEAYDHANDILLDDIVVWGYATAVPIIPEAYHECLVQYAVLTLKSSLNETDNEVAALLKEMFASMKGDTAGRKLGVRIERNFSLRSNYLTQSRRMGRR